MNDPTTTEHATPGDPHEDVLIILPVRNLVLYPGVVAPLSVQRPKTVAGVQEAVRTGRKVGLLLQRDASVEEPTPADLHAIGTVASILRHGPASATAQQLIVQGEQRFRVLHVGAAVGARLPDPGVSCRRTRMRNYGF